MQTETPYEPFDLANAYLVYPRGDKLELTDSVRPSVACASLELAEAIRGQFWAATGEVVPPKSKRDKEINI